MTLGLVKECVNSLVKYTDLDDLEIIIVANGASPALKDQAVFWEDAGVPINLLWFDKPIGAVIAYNEGIKAAKGEYVVLLNDDCQLLPAPKNAWLNFLLEPFSDPLMACTGPFRMDSGMSPGLIPEANREFIIFFCAAIPNRLFKELGILDDNLKCGVDVDFCVRAQQAGYKIQQVPTNSLAHSDYDAKLLIGDFPIYHQGEGTVHDHYGFDNWQKIIEKDIDYLNAKYAVKMTRVAIDFGEPSIHAKDVLCLICTKNRYDSTLPLAIQSVIMQTTKPAKLIIYDDNTEDDRVDIRENETYAYLLEMLDRARIEWEVIFGERKGQHYGHQFANKQDYKFVWRLDDDEVAEPNTLDKYLRLMNDDVGAVGGTVLTRGFGGQGSGKIEHIFSSSNVQWQEGKEIIEVDHLHSTFLYRAGIVDYNLELSPVAHREETLFSYELKQKGYRLLVDTSIITHHLKQMTTGIRSHNSEWFYQHDEKIFKKKLEEWGIKIINLDSGIGDHFAFLNIVPASKRKWEKLIIGVCFPDIFIDHPDITLISIAQSSRTTDDNIYKWMWDRDWKQSIVNAYAEMFEVTI